MSQCQINLILPIQCGLLCKLFYMFASHLWASEVCAELKVSKVYAHDMKTRLVKMCISQCSMILTILLKKL